MNTTVKLFALAVMVSVTFVSCCNKQKEELKRQVENFNNNCPMSLGGIGSINSLTYDGDVVTMKFIINEIFAPISSLSNHQQEAKESLAISLSSDSNKELIDLMISSGITLKTTFVGNQSGQKADFSFSPGEMRETMDRFSAMNDKQKLIVSTLISTKIQLPLVIDRTTKIVELALTSDALVYTFEINDADTFEGYQNTDLAKGFILSGMANDLNNDFIGRRYKQLYQALIDCNQGLVYNYYESGTGRRIEICISTNEIKEVLNGERDDTPTAEDWENLMNFFEDIIGDEESQHISNVVHPYDWSGNYVAEKDCGGNYRGVPIIFTTAFSLQRLSDEKYTGTIEINGYQTYYAPATVEGFVNGNRIRVFFVSSPDDGLNHWSDLCDENTPLFSLSLIDGQIIPEWYAALCETECIDWDTPIIKE